MRKFILLIIVLAVGIALGIYYQKQSKPKTIEDKVRTSAGQVGDSVKEGVQNAGAIASDVKDDIKTGAQKAVEVTTNVAAKVKTDVTNAVGEIKQKMN